MTASLPFQLNRESTSGVRTAEIGRADPRQFHSLAPMYYRNAQAAVVVYDITKSVGLPPDAFGEIALNIRRHWRRPKPG